VLRRQFESPLIWVLLGSGGLAMAVDWHGEGIKNGLVILAVVLVNSVIGFIQEYRAGRAIDALSRMMPESIPVSRDGRRVSIPVAEIVPGDLVHVASGDRVPADGRIIACRGLTIDEAALTGESVPAAKSVAPVSVDAPLGDRTCMLHGGTLVTAGAGTAVITATGSRTELGRISELIETATDLETPLTRGLRTIGIWISLGIVAVSLLILAIGVFRTVATTDVGVVQALRETLIFAIALAVGAIPEGLPAIVTIALAVGVRRMSDRRAIIRRLPVVEALGSTTVICSDKTGTLTRNEMTVRAAWTPVGGEAEFEGVGYEPHGAMRSMPAASGAVADGGSASRPDLDRLLRVATLCNDASLARVDDRWVITGDPTEAALVVAARKLGLDEDDLRARHPRLDAIPFESERQFMATLHDESDRDGGTICVKGAPEAVAARCGQDVPPTFRDVVDALASRGLRVLAVAEREVPSETGDLRESDVADLRLLGLVGMIDPPRPEAIDAVATCRRAGITVKMITGDHHVTAAAIGRQLGLLEHGDEAIPGGTLESEDDATLRRTATTRHVFARVAPEHKLRLVRALQTEGAVVAMTGDGANDAPALRQADVGVAMGITGTSVAKESAAVVLADDNFASITAAVEEGRRVYDNLVKSLAFVLPTNIGLALILLAAVAVFPFDAATGELLLPMSPLQLLWINLVATVALALPLAFEAAEPDVMSRPPRPPSAPILDRFVAGRTFLVAALMAAGAIGVFLHLHDAADPSSLARAQTGSVTTVVLFQVFYLFNCRSLRDSILSIGLFTNGAVFGGVLLVGVLQTAFVLAPPMQRVFESAPLSPRALLSAALAAAVVLPVVALEKTLRRRVRRATAPSAR